MCADGDQLAAAVGACHPDVVLVDIRMPPTMTDEGIRLAARLRRTHPEIGVIAMSAHSDPTYALALLEGGSEGRALPPQDRLHSRAQLLATIETVARGGSVIDPKVVEALVHGRSRQARSPLDVLTPREREILVEMARGASNAAIGGEPGPDRSAPSRSTSTRCSPSSISRSPRTSAVACARSFCSSQVPTAYFLP